MKTVNSYVGTPVKRLEDFRFLTGRGQYVGDLKRENLLHAVILRSPMAHCVIVAIDTARARALPEAPPSPISGLITVPAAASAPPFTDAPGSRLSRADWWRSGTQKQAA